MAFTPVGQIGGEMNKVRRSADVVIDMVTECIESLERSQAMLRASVE